MTKISVDKHSSFFRRLQAYFAERFPLLSHGILIVSYYSSNQFLAQILNTPNSPVRYAVYSAGGAVIIFCMFLHLRVFDEHKDYEEDCKHYPGRILSRNLITLGHLKIIGVIAIILELVLGAMRGFPAFIAIVLVVLYSLLMLKEFFVGKWLKQNFLIYSVSHMLIMPLMALAVYSYTTLKYPWEAPGWFWVYAFVGFFVTFNWEISRKVRAPEDEIDEIGSYSRILGTFGAAYLVIIIRVIDTVMVSFVGWHLGLSKLFYFVLVVLFLVCLNGLIQFRRKPSAKNAKRMEVYAGIYIIAFDLTLAIEIIRAYGIQF